MLIAIRWYSQFLAMVTYSRGAAKPCLALAWKSGHRVLWISPPSWQ